MQAKAIIISGNGTNCETETAYACKLAGFEVVDIVHISKLLSGEIRLDDYHFLNLAGGFLDGDDLGAAKAGVNRFLHARLENSQDKIEDQLLKFISDGKLILGICNGFQLMVKLGLLPGFKNNYTKQKTTLTFNDSGRFENRWVYLKANPDSPCIFTKNIHSIYLPVRHGEGKFVTDSNETLEKIKSKQHISLQYCEEDCLEPSMKYPYNPNGSVDAIAGICDESGLLFGLMPHPEAYLHYTNHPHWTRKSLPEEGAGLKLFKNAFSYIKKHG
ncbi:MAG: phosphoribosylformylglycinamidine synthase subunit PurQ [bacterium]|nr:phosphoribosylformylglycinamidine synthase subunit PurQ [bacterium]